MLFTPRALQTSRPGKHTDRVMSLTHFTFPTNISYVDIKNMAIFIAAIMAISQFWPLWQPLIWPYIGRQYG